jgi:hypothetical protein
MDDDDDDGCHGGGCRGRAANDMKKQVRREMKQIEDTTSQHVTFSKHRSGLQKKVFDLLVLCDGGIRLILFSLRNRMYYFASATEYVLLISLLASPSPSTVPCAFFFLFMMIQEQLNMFLDGLFLFMGRGFNQYPILVKRPEPPDLDHAVILLHFKSPYAKPGLSLIKI